MAQIKIVFQLLLGAFLTSAGLQKYQPPKPLEIVAESQVKLVCWMAVKGQQKK